MILEIGKTSFRLSFSFIAFVVIMMLLFDEKTVFLSLFSSIIHESGHLVFIYFTGSKPKNVEFTLFGIRIDRYTPSETSYYKEALIASGGIIFNLLFALFCYIIYSIKSCEIFLMLTIVNLIIVFINSVPVSILDFGRTLKYIIMIYSDSEKSEKVLTCISYTCVGIFSAATIIYTVFYGVNFSLIAVTLYIISITVIKKWS